MNRATDINLTYDLFSLVSKDTTIRKTGAGWYAGPCPWCGGKDRFVLKQTASGWRWFCRQCGDASSHTSIDYLMRRDSLSFVDALRAMGGDVQQRSKQAVTTQPRPIELPSADWQSKAWARVDRACNRLDHDEEAKEYLLSRGLIPGSWYAYLLGAAEARDPELKVNRLAILIPWFDNDTITALSFRFIDNQPGGLRYKTLGKRLLYGVNNLAGVSTLVLVEGELNAISLYQASASVGGMGLDVLSIGSESIGVNVGRMILAAADRYQKVITWLDRPERSKAVSSAIGRSCKALTSPVVDRVKYDANELLKRGLLVDFLRALEL